MPGKADEAAMPIFLRLAIFFVLAAVGLSFLLYLTTGNRRYLGFAWGLIKFSLVFLLIVAMLFALERMILVI